MAHFYNPYHFVPLEPGVGVELDRELDELRDPARSSAAHDRYAEGTHSGRIVCHLQTKTPTFVGGTQRNGDPEKTPYTIGGADPREHPEHTALPASSLRGMLSAVLEALSASTLRVLEDQEYQYREGREGPFRIPETTFVFFDRVDTRLRPLHPDRAGLTLAEQVLGVVEDVPEPTSGTADADARAWASRVRLSDARIQRTPKLRVFEDKAVWLKALLSPKPPAPSFYFRTQDPGGSDFIAKSVLGSLHVPQGRKFYLHHSEIRLRRPWLTRKLQPDRNVQASVRPILPERNFIFYLDYENLSDLELGAVLYALEPGRDFWHKLGTGKSIGMGSVQLRIIAALPVPRGVARYSKEGVFAPRYGEPCVCNRRLAKKWRELGPASSREQSAVAAYMDDEKGRRERRAAYEVWHDAYVGQEGLGDEEDLETVRNIVEESWCDTHGVPVPAPVIDGEPEWMSRGRRAFDEAFPPGGAGRQALLTIGNRGRASRHVVHTPLVDGVEPGTAAAEEETFQWYKTNEVQRSQGLRPVVVDPQPGEAGIKPLESLPKTS